MFKEKKLANDGLLYTGKYGNYDTVAAKHFNEWHMKGEVNLFAYRGSLLDRTFCSESWKRRQRRRDRDDWLLLRKFRWTSTVAVLKTGWTDFTLAWL